MRGSSDFGQGPKVLILNLKGFLLAVTVVTYLQAGLGSRCFFVFCFFFFTFGRFYPRS